MSIDIKKTFRNAKGCANRRAKVLIAEMIITTKNQVFRNAKHCAKGLKKVTIHLTIQRYINTYPFFRNAKGNGKGLAKVNDN